MPSVLIVENPLLSLFLAGLVARAGFEAIQVGNADEALSMLERRPDIALLITNVAMEGSMDGVELVHAVNKRWPSLKLMVVTGRPGLSERDLPKACLFLTKPYYDEEMLFEIRALMEMAAG